ncbi:MAG: hypothetical protein SFV52_09330 [Saprospiraceae bacterium]|nr:hypothetical protein [Saprospiraceae bacterium]
MNSSDLWPNAIRFAGLTALQALLLRQVGLSIGPYFNLLVYPLFILLLPIATPTALVVILGFLIGLTVDLFYGTLGLHAGAGVFSGFIRTYLLAAFEPKGGYSGKEPTALPHFFDWRWFTSLLAVFLLLHCLWYFSMDAFTFVYIGTITLKTLSAWALSMPFTLLLVFLFNPKR